MNAQVDLVPLVSRMSKQDSIKQVEMEYCFAFSEGAKQKMIGNLDRSKEYYMRCIQLQPNKPTPYYELASILFVGGDSETARGYIEQALILDNTNEWFKFIAIEIAASQERFIDGAGYYKDLYVGFDDREEFRTGEIDMLLMAKEYKEALKRLDDVESKFGYSKYIAIRKKDIFLSTGKDKSAFKELEKMIKEFPDEVEVIGILAELYADKGNEEKALALFNKMKAMNSGNPLVYFSLGKYYLDLDRKEEAIAEFHTGFASKQVNPDIKIQVFLELVRTQTADASLNESLAGLLEVMYQTDKGNSSVDVLYADYLFNLGLEEKSEVIYKRITEKTPANFLAWQNLLFIQNSQLDFKEMVEIASDASENYPNQPLFLLFKGIGASQTDQLELAIEALNAGLDININNTDLTKQFYISLGDTYYEMDKYQEAFRNFNNLLALEPDNTVVLNNYSYYLSLLDQDLEKALGMIERCIGIEPDNATYLDTYAWILFKNEKFEKALEVIEKALSLSESPSGEGLEHYGDILYRNSNPEKAREEWKRADRRGGASDKIKRKIESVLK